MFYCSWLLGLRREERQHVPSNGLLNNSLFVLRSKDHVRDSTINKHGQATEPYILNRA